MGLGEIQFDVGINNKRVNLLSLYDNWFTASIYGGLIGLGVGYAFMKVPTNKLPLDKKYLPYVGTFALGSTLHFIFRYTALDPQHLAWQIRERRRNFTSQIPGYARLTQYVPKKY